MQLPTDYHGVRRHSGGSSSSSSGRSNDSTDAWPLRRRSLQPTGSSPAVVIDDDDDGPLDPALLGGCRRRSFSVTPKGDVVNEGDEILPHQGLFLFACTINNNAFLYHSRLIRNSGSNQCVDTVGWVI